MENRCIIYILDMRSILRIVHLLACIKKREKEKNHLHRPSPIEPYIYMLQYKNRVRAYLV